MELVFKYLRKYDINRVGISVSGSEGSGGANSIWFAARGETDLPSDMQADLENHLTQWTNDYLYDQYGEWYQYDGGEGALTLWWDEDGGKGEMDFVEYSNTVADLPNENRQALMVEFNCYLNQHPKLVEWLKNEKIKFLVIEIKRHTDDLESLDSISFEPYVRDKEDFFKEPNGEILNLLREFTTTELALQVADGIEKVASTNIENAFGYVGFILNRSGYADKIQDDLYYGYIRKIAHYKPISKQALLKIDDMLPPGLRARIEKDLLRGSVQQPNSARTKQTQQKKAMSLGL